jgi:GNAT superfamily N-acetyltransferase
VTLLLLSLLLAAPFVASLVRPLHLTFGQLHVKCGLYDVGTRSSRAWLDDLYVDEHVRSRGVGRALLERLAGLARERGCGRIEWTAAGANARALAFYRGHGASVSESTRLCRLDEEGIERLAKADR